MIDNFAIGFFTICIIYTAFRAIKIERMIKEENMNPDKELEGQQPRSILEDVLPKKPI